MPETLPEKSRCGIGEWFGSLFTSLTPDNRREKIDTLAKPVKEYPDCPFKIAPFIKSKRCHKQGGVCSLRVYKKAEETGQVSAGDDLVVTCPARFYQADTIFSKIGSTILGTSAAQITSQVPFLIQRPGIGEKKRGRKAVGSIDNVLVVERGDGDLDWCAVEIQAVYFSGKKMTVEFESLKSSDEEMPFPVGDRRPDFRSSGPKRLMPQLQIKVPTLRRWGKKMAVVVDESFFASLGGMPTEADLSSCDIVWFVVRLQVEAGQATLAVISTHFVTLERAVESLTGGTPVSQGEFEETIRKKIRGLNKAAKRKALSTPVAAKTNPDQSATHP